MIMAVTVEQRKSALDLLLPYQRSDFEGIFRAMDGTSSLFQELGFEAFRKDGIKLSAYCLVVP